MVDSSLKVFAESYFLFLKCNYSTRSAFKVAVLFHLVAFSLKENYHDNAIKSTAIVANADCT